MNSNPPTPPTRADADMAGNIFILIVVTVFILFFSVLAGLSAETEYDMLLICYGVAAVVSGIASIVAFGLFINLANRVKHIVNLLEEANTTLKTIGRNTRESLNEVNGAG